MNIYRIFFKPLSRAILIGSLLLTLWSVWLLANNPVGHFLTVFAEAELKTALNELTTSTTTKAQLEEALEEEVDATPRDWIVIESLQSIAEEKGYEFSPAVVDKVNAANDEDNSFRKAAVECGRCAWNNSACDSLSVMACGMVANMTPVGDFAGITRAGLAYSRGEDIDEVDAALSVVGLGATALAFTSAGTSLTVKAGAGFLRFAYLSGKVPVSITKVLRTAAKDGIAWHKLPTVRKPKDLSSLLRMKSLQPAIEAAADMGGIASRAGPQQGLYLLENARDVAELKKISSAVTVLKDKTAGYFRLLGKNKILRATLRIADGVYELILGLLGVLFSISSTVLSRRIERGLRGKAEDAS